MGTIGTFELSLVVVVAAVLVFPVWRIVSKTGMPGILSLFFFVPIANIIMLFVLAFAKWPIERRLEEAQRGQT